MKPVIAKLDLSGNYIPDEVKLSKHSLLKMLRLSESVRATF